MSKFEVEAMNRVRSNRFPNWPPAQDRPINPVVSVSFSGLLAFCYNPQGWCEVGFYQADGRHRLEIQVLEDNAPLSLRNLPAHIRTMRLGILINEVEKPASVRFLKDGSDYDFRWVLDLENDEFYPEHYGMKAAFQANLFVRHGVFYTKERTLHTLDKISRELIETGLKLGWNPQPLDRCAKDICAGIDLTANEKVSLVVNNQEVVRLPIKPNTKYEIKFSNECKIGDQPCPFTWNHWRESQRNDFYFHRELLKLPILRTKYGVVVTEGQIHGKHEDVTDEAPCMGAGFGQTAEFPSS